MIINRNVFYLVTKPKLLLNKLIKYNVDLTQRCKHTGVHTDKYTQPPVFIQNFGDVAMIRLNRPSHRNAIDRKLLIQLIDSIKEFDQNDEYKVGILCGSGGNFSIGLDWRDFNDTKQLQLIDQLFELLPTFKPLVAAIEGYSTCLAFQLACMCDFRVAEGDSVFGMHQASLPVHPKVKTILKEYKLNDRTYSLLYQNLECIPIKDAFDQHLINEITRVGCALGRSIQLSKSLGKFSQPALLLDRANVWKTVLGSHTCASLSSRLDLINEQTLIQEMKKGAERFLTMGYGRLNSSRLHSLEEIFQMSQTKIFDEQELIDTKQD